MKKLIGFLLLAFFLVIATQVAPAYTLSAGMGTVLGDDKKKDDKKKDPPGPVVVKEKKDPPPNKGNDRPKKEKKPDQ